MEQDDESIRALYFAPLPLIVLNAARTIKQVNGPAESILGVDVTKCLGQRLERFIDPSSHKAYGLALGDASKASCATASGTAHPPVATRIQLHPSEGHSRNIWFDLSISAWFPSDVIPRISSGAARSTESKSLPPNSNSSSSNSNSNNASTTSLRVPHEAMYTISIVPSSSSKSSDRDPSPTSDSKAEVISVLREVVFKQMDTAILALSKDGETEIRNKACDEIFKGFASPPEELDTIDDMDLLGGGRNRGGNYSFLKWIEQTIDVYDAEFEKVFVLDEWPIHKCARLGQSSPRTTIGLESRITKSRVVLEVESKAIRDQGGYGKHIGGVVSFRNVTAEREKMKHAAEVQGEKHFRQTVDSIAQLVWVGNASGYIEWYSESYLQFTGCSESELIGGGWQGIVHEDDLQETGKRWSYSIHTGMDLEVAFRLRKFTGEYRWVLGKARPLRDEKTNLIIKWFGTCTDVHDQVEALSASRQTQIQLQSVINHAAVTLWAVDREGIITVAEGPGLQQLTHNTSSDSTNYTVCQCSNHKVEPESVVGQSIYKVWKLANVKESIEKALQGQSVVEEVEIEGTWFRTSYSPLRAQPSDVLHLYNVMNAKPSLISKSGTGSGDITGVVAASMDITDRKLAQKQMEESLLEKTRALAAEGAAREASRLKSQFLANMSHEIRTPIAGVIGLSELLLDEDGLTKRQREYLETVQSSAEGLLSVINDVLDFSKVEIGKLDVEQVPFNLVVLLRDLKRMLSFATLRKGLEFRDSIQLDYDGLLVGDLGRLRQVVTNLLTNAIKFTANGFISLEVTQLPAKEEKDGVLIQFDIRDSGCGIAKEALSRLFQPFSQADASTARRFGGTGLGLSISKNLVELMKGNIQLTSEEGKGCHARFTIPFQKAPTTTAASKTVKGEDLETMDENARMGVSIDGDERNSNNDLSLSLACDGLPINLTTKFSRPREDIRILVAEDNVVNARIASRYIEKMGFNCQIAENGLMAIEELNKSTFDLVLMDCQMPICDGYEATRLIRSSNNIDVRTLPIIALTASAIKGDRERALLAGMVDYHAKPIRRTALEVTICKWLFDHNTRQSLAKFLSPAATPISRKSITPEVEERRLSLSSHQSPNEKTLQSFATKV